MVGHYLRIFWANFNKNIFLYFTGIISLVIGVCTSIILLQAVLYERDFDKCFKNSGNIYRITLDFYNNNKLEVKSCQSFFPLSYELSKEYPEISEFSRIIKMNDSWIFKYKELSIYEDRACIVDKSFINQFSIKLVKGDTTNLTSKFLISQSFAKKQFGNEDPVGKVLTLTTFLGKWDLEVAGIYQDMPDKSHFKFDCMVFVIPSFEPVFKNNWGNNFIYSYLTLNPNTNIKNLEQKITEYIKNKKNQSSVKIIAHLQPIESIHLNSALDGEIYPNGNGKIVSLYIMLSIFIFLISFIIYLNLISSLIIQRNKEINLKKVIGSSQLGILSEFLFESILLNLASLTLGILAAVFVGKYISSHNIINLSPGLWQNHNFWLTTSLFFIFSVCISSLLSILLTSSSGAYLVNSLSNKNRKIMSIKKGLVFFQYIISIGIIAGMLIIFFQIKHMQNVSLGFDKNNVLVLKAVVGRDSVALRNVNLFKEELRKESNIVQISNTEKIPGNGDLSTSSVKRMDDNVNEMNEIYKISIDYNYINTFNLKLIAGRNYSPEFGDETNNVILNETAVKKLGFKSPVEAINKYIFEKSRYEKKLKVIGVISDFHQQYVKFAIPPTMYLYYAATPGCFAIKLQSLSQSQNSIKNIKETWLKIYPDTPFQYYFLDDYYDSQYKSEWQFALMMVVLLVIVIVLSCIGLLGLSSYSCYQRTKEVGIRRVCGASIGDILILFYKEYFYFLIFSSVISLTLTYWLFYKWLEDYASKVKIGLWFVLLPLFIIGAITFLTVTFHIMKSANANTSKVLKYE